MKPDMRHLARPAWLACGIAVAFLATSLSLRASGPTESQEESDVETIATDLEGYNVMTFSNFTSEGSDVVGSIAVGGDLLGGNTFSVGSGIDSSYSHPGLYIGGSGSSALQATVDLGGYGYASTPNITGYSWSSPILTVGSYEINETNSSSSYKSTNPVTGSLPGNPNLSTIKTSLASVAGSSGTGLGAAAASGSFSVSNNTLNFSTSVTNGVAVFNMTLGSGAAGSNTFNASANEYNGVSFNQLTFTVPTGVNYVINVTGEANNAEFLSGVGFLNPSGDNALLWNFGTTSDTINLANNDTFVGSIIAPDASIQGSGNVFDAEVAASNFSGQSGEIESNNFQTAFTPEPSTYVLWACGICGVAILFRLRPAGFAFRRIKASRVQSLTGAA